MNSLRLFLILGCVGALAVTGCDPKAKCVADCDTSDIMDESSGSGSESGSESGSPGNLCEATESEAEAFLMSNRQCETHDDCVLAGAICYQGEGRGQCGDVALSADADRAQWDALHGVLEGCGECGANACGATAICNVEGICEAQLFGPEVDCALAEQEVERFLDENRACDGDEDCVYVDKGCYDGPLAECVAISLNADADLDVWNELQAPLGDCGHECGGNDCGASTRCGPEGLCEAVFP